MTHAIGTFHILKVLAEYGPYHEVREGCFRLETASCSSAGRPRKHGPPVLGCHCKRKVPSYDKICYSVFILCENGICEESLVFSAILLSWYLQ